MEFDILTLFPEFFDSPLKQSIIGRAIEDGLVRITQRNIRDYATDRHSTVDDSPYGGGPGMVMKVEPVVAAIEAARGASADAAAKVLLTTPQGRPFSQETAEELSHLDRLIIVCGRYEGVDERVRSFVDMEVSVGDYVLSGGEGAALVIIDAVARLVPRVIEKSSLEAESFSDALLEYPQYTRPEEFRGMVVPDVLLSGNHAQIKRWRDGERLKRTKERRPELLKDWQGYE